VRTFDKPVTLASVRSKPRPKPAQRASIGHERCPMGVLTLRRLSNAGAILTCHLRGEVWCESRFWLANATVRLWHKAKSTDVCSHVGFRGLTRNVSNRTNQTLVTHSGPEQASPVATHAINRCERELVTWLHCHNRRKTNGSAG